MGEPALQQPNGRFEMPYKILPIFQKPKRFKMLYGGRGAGKSDNVGDGLIMSVDTMHIKVGCFREYQNTIEDSVYPLLKDKIIKRNLPNWDIHQNQILNRLGGSFRFRGIARNPMGVKSMYGFHIFWYEEAQIMSEESLELVTKTLREDGSEHWFTLNPQSVADPISQRFLEPYRNDLDNKGYYEDDLHLIIKVNYYDNPWFKNTPLELDRQHDKERLPKAQYEHIWLGEYNDTIENALISTEWFEAAVNAHERLGFKPMGAKVVAHDPADQGEDEKGLVVRHGSVVLDADARSDGNVNDMCDWSLNRAITEQADLYVWDGDGMGAALARQVSQAFAGKKIDYRIFKGSGEVDKPEELYNAPEGLDRTKAMKNREYFRNKRAQRYCQLRDRFYNTWLAVDQKKYMDPDTMISISPDIKKLPQLKTEVCRIPRKINPNGVFQIMSKPEMKKLKLKSPGMADSLMASLEIPDIIPDSKPMEFASLW